MIIVCPEMAKSPQKLKSLNNETNMLCLIQDFGAPDFRLNPEKNHPCLTIKAPALQCHLL